MLQTVMQLSKRSRTTSYSTSFHPFRLFSTSTCGENDNAFSTRDTSSSRLSQNPEPRPPRAYAARTITGYPSSSAAATASSTEETASLLMVFTFISSSFFTNSSRSSVSIIACTGVPSTLTPNSSRVPSSYSLTPQFRAVCPPKARKMPSGRSFSITLRTKYGVTGRKYILSANPSDVCTVAIFGFMSTVEMPSSFIALSACEPL